MRTGFSLKKTSTVSLSIDVRITMISGVVYLLRIFKMFHGLMNNPVYAFREKGGYGIYNGHNMCKYVEIKCQLDATEVFIADLGHPVGYDRT